ncbi:hypothetical protein [Oceanirhabdus sp. W0125-5]|uniref:hypothetical protein n=1 Tax=Oceanirhabdus sp. W0125-5 TaxID=2999116 RepID=UPI0022F2AF9C|nr:hypothetical protein [Oceanirhabdus sp. W0125-5]WBW96054.1 hypothetical protein OW730_20520 [Oceanirhabdus sp. W0125-5]
MKDCDYREEIENDLKRYLDWCIRIESVEEIYGCVEDLEDTELNRIKRKVLAINKILNRLSEKNRKIIKEKYFYGHSRERILEDNKLSKNQFYEVIRRLLGVFEREINNSI